MGLLKEMMETSFKDLTMEELLYFLGVLEKRIENIQCKTRQLDIGCNDLERRIEDIQFKTRQLDIGRYELPEARIVKIREFVEENS